MGGSFLYLRGTLQGRGVARKRVCPRRDYDASVRVAGIGHRAGGGRAGSRHGVLKTETKVAGGWDTQWKVLEGAWVVGTRGLEFRCYTECNISPHQFPFLPSPISVRYTPQPFVTSIICPREVKNKDHRPRSIVRGSTKFFLLYDYMYTPFILLQMQR